MSTSPEGTRPAPIDAVPTQVRLIEAAERRIAAVGVEAASLRAINAEAGLNVAAAHYHFRSKAALVRAALAHRMDELTRRRQPLLARLAGEPRPPLRAVVDAFVQPLDDVRRVEPWGQTYLRFLASLARADEPWRSTLTSEAMPHLKAFNIELARAVPELPRPVLRLRFGWASLTAVTALADLGTERAPRMRQGQVVSCLVDYVVGALEA